MTTLDIVRELCEKQNISFVELCRLVGQILHYFSKKSQRRMVSLKKIM